MKETKQAKKQYRKQLRAQRELAMVKSAQNHSNKRKGTGRYMTAAIVVLSLFTNVGEISAIAGNLF